MPSFKEIIQTILFRMNITLQGNIPSNLSSRDLLTLHRVLFDGVPSDVDIKLIKLIKTEYNYEFLFKINHDMTNQFVLFYKTQKKLGFNNENVNVYDCEVINSEEELKFLI